MKLNHVTNTLEIWFGFLRNTFVELFKKLLKVNLYGYAAVLIGLIVAGALVAGGILWGGLAAVVLIVLAAIVFLVSILANSLISLASYKVVEEQQNNKREVNILGVALENALPFILYGVIIVSIYVLAIIPFLGAGILLGGFSLTALQLLMTFFEFAFVLISVAIGFFLQFAIYEIVLAGKWPVEAIRESVSLVKNNFVETLVFFFVRAAINWIVQIPFTIVLYVVIFAGFISVLGGALAASALSPTILLVIFALAGIIGVIFLIAYLLVYSTTEDTVMIPLTYNYWKRLKDEVTVTTTLSSAQKAELAKKVKELKKRSSK